jgi:hypothetical protein
VQCLGIRCGSCFKVRSCAVHALRAPRPQAAELRALRLPCTAGLFMAPTMVGESTKGGMLLQKVLSEAGHHAVHPLTVRCQQEADSSSSSSGSMRTDTEASVLRLPGVSACMGSAQSMHAMLRAVESSACMATAAAPPSQVLVTTRGSGGARSSTNESTQGAFAARKASKHLKVGLLLVASSILVFGISSCSFQGAATEHSSV